MKIGQLASACGCGVETIRYYEKAGLLPKPERLENGYRNYNAQHEQWLQFILRSRSLGFTQTQVKQLSNLADLDTDVCTDVHALILEHLQDVETKLADLQKMRAALRRLENKCQNGALNACPLIDELMA